MKFITFAVAISISNLAYANSPKIIDCKVTQVLNSNVFEESLSVDEYPEVSILEESAGQMIAYIGASVIKSNNDVTIAQQPSTGFDKIFSIDLAEHIEQYSIVVSGNVFQRSGVLSARTRDNKSENYSDWQQVALLKCK